MLSFKRFFEMSDAADADTSDVFFKKNYDGEYVYSFKIGGEDYNVKFSPTVISLANPHDQWLPKVKIVEFGFAYDITLDGPSGYSLTNKGNGPSVYRHLIKGVKKFIETIKPEGFHFYGAVEYQDIVYQSFYERFLKKLYTKISGQNYLKNDLFQEIKQAAESGQNLVKWEAIEKAMGLAQNDKRLENLKKRKEDERKNFLSGQSFVGKIVYSADYDVAVYVSQLERPDKFIGLYTYDGIKLNQMNDLIRNIKGFEGKEQKHAEEIKRLAGLLWQTKQIKTTILGSPGSVPPYLPAVSQSLQQGVGA